jgi:hypothetical protein
MRDSVLAASAAAAGGPNSGMPLPTGSVNGYRDSSRIYGAAIAKNSAARAAAVHRGATGIV